MTTPGCRDISCKGKRSRQDQVIATSIAKTSGRDIMEQSRQREQETKVPTTPGCRDNSCKDQRVAIRSRGRDIKIQGIKQRR